MKTVFCFIILYFSSTNADLAGECDLAGYYLELGCTPLPKDANTTNCPNSFYCPDLHPDPEKCFYRGTPYGDGALIPQNLINNPCSQVCICSVSPTPQFECAAVDCVEIFDSDTEQDCINTYELDSCCSTGTVCGKDAIASLNTCEVDGQIYKEGQLFQPVNTRKNCICTAQWTSSYDDPSSCRDINCGVEIHYQEMIFNKCAPVFIGDLKNCPISFECQTSKTKIIRGLNLKSVNSQCSFGNMTLNVGDEITLEESCTKCSCYIPPFVSCIRRTSCDD